MLFVHSKSGFTKRYADWIAQELGCDVKPYKEFEKTDIKTGDMVIFGSRVFAGKVQYLDKVKVRAQNLIVFATGATPAAATDVIDGIWSGNLSETERQSIPHFYMQSGLDYGKMGFLDRTLMKMVAKFMSKKKEKSKDESAFAQAITASYDISSKEYVMPLVQCVNEKQKVQA
ncbi:MAG: flavodoxin domain-containing protein [Clostridia bacterium]|nr:flavodoxin domain-containing protein [Clostridia bacterium]